MIAFGEVIQLARWGKRAPLAERFWSRVNKARSGCWEWAGYLRENGYGYLFVTLKSGRRAHVLAHRLSWWLHHGEIPPGLDVYQNCRNRRCVNPEHLEPVTIRTAALRGESFAAVNARKTHCNEGHPLSGENLYVCPKGYRQCRACRQQKQDARRRPLAA